MASVSRCRSCGADIVWAVTIPGRKRIPLDYEPVPAETKAAMVLLPGDWAYTPEDLARRMAEADGMTLTEARHKILTKHSFHLSHFATCPNADAHRKRNVSAPAPGQHHHDGPDTEREAAESVTATTGRLRQKVLAALHEAGSSGLTDDEGAQVLGFRDRLMFGKRRHELVEAGLVEDSGDRRQTPTGRRAVVWMVTE